jgi:hypothetical protein
MSKTVKFVSPIAALLDVRKLRMGGICKWRETKAGAALMDVPTESKREEFVSHMALGRSDSVLWDVPIKPKREEFVNSMALM